MADLSDGGQPTISIPINPTSTTGEDKHLPVEIIAQVIAHVVVDGATFSNGSADYVNSETIRSLLKTSREIRAETLRQVFDRPVHIVLTGEKICGCDLSVPKFSASCNSFMYMFLHVPLEKWASLIIHFRPLPTTASLGIDIAEDVELAADSPYPNLAARKNFLSAFEITKHYAQRLSLTLSFIKTPYPNIFRGRPRVDERLLQGFHIYEQDLISESTDRKWRAPLRRIQPSPVHFIFESPPDLVATEEIPSIPLWSVGMIDDLLSPWVYNVQKQRFEEQIKMPDTMATPYDCCYLESHFLCPVSPQVAAMCAKHIEGAMRLNWQRNLDPAHKHVNVLYFCFAMVSAPPKTWYLRPQTLKKSSTSCPSEGTQVLRITTGAGLPMKQDIWGAPFWKGEFFSFNG